MGDTVQLESYPLQRVTVRDSCWDDCRVMAPNMRKADEMEVMAACGYSPYKALCQAYAVSETCLTVLYEDRPCLMMGCCADTVDKNTGIVWALGTEEIGKFGRMFIRESPRWLDHIRGKYTTVKNYTHADNVVHHKWLKHLGFTLEGPYLYGVDYEYFYYIQKDF